MHPRLLRISLLVGSLLAIGILMSMSAGMAYHSYLLSVQELMAGLRKSTSPEQKGFFLIDVRSPGEHATGMIPGTDLNIDFRNVKQRHQEIGAKLEDHIVVYCQTGQRSNIAAETLADLGYTHVYNVAGSMTAWMEAGYPLESPKR